jgi:hypothetical protein
MALSSGVFPPGYCEPPRGLVLAHIVLSGNVVLAGQEPTTPDTAKKISLREDSVL